MATITTSIRIDAQLKREQGLPFRPTRDIPNAETLAAMREADHIAADPDAHGYTSVDDLFADLDA